MSTARTQISKRQLLAAAIPMSVAALAFAWLITPARAAPTDAESRVAATPDSAQATVLVTVFLKANTFTDRLPKRATDLLTSAKGSTAARRAAQLNPYQRSDTESVAASIAENSRNAALPLIRKAAAPDVALNDSVQRMITQRGGSVVSASPIPNQIVARVPANALPAIENDARVRRVIKAETPIEMAAPIDGSAIWWTNGFTGQGGSADGDGSPDAVVFDTGIRTTHEAFKARLPSDCSTCNGGGDSRIVSPEVRADFSGSKHGNTIGAQLAATDLGNAGGGGMAYGIDKLYDNYEATNPYLWDLGITSGSDTGLAGKSDLPEVINYSAGIYQDDVDLDPAWNYFDALESRFGILNTVSAGNCGVQTPSIDGCNDGQHRVSTPGTNYNVMTTGGLDVTADPTNIATYAPWPNTSPGPTWGGRKKPDLVAPVFGTAGTPSAMDDTSWTSFGYGTSFAAPVAAGGALLLASSGVYLPTAQKAIMINSATPVQGQTYWTPRTGWGALNMTNAYYARGNYANGTVTGSGANSARFFELTGVAVDDRATLVWNRRTTTDSTLDPDYYDLTDLDLSQFDPGTLDPTSTGGSDASDPVDTDQTITADNPMPSEGNDGGDNIEQIRSTGTGSQILKVKSQSPVDGATSEPFSVAAANAPVALQTPIPEVTVTTLPTTTGLTQDFTVTATVENPSADLALDSPSVELTLPAGTTTLISGDNPQAIPTLAPSGTGVATWTVQATTAGTKTLTAAATGTAYGESFSGTGSAQINVDSTPPTATIAAPPTYSPTLSPTFTWSATDSQSTVASYDVEAAVDQGGWVSQLIDTTDTSISLTATEGQLVRLRVRATDSLDNTSDWSEVSTTLDSLPPVVLFGAVDASVRGTLQVPVIIFNAGSPTTSNFTFSDTVGGRTGSVTNGAVLQYKNTTSRTVLANLRVTATDALGRAVTTTAVYPVPPRVAPSNMRLIRLSRVGRFVKLTGSTAKGYNGKITFAATRIGKKGTRRARRTVPVKNGRFSIRLRVAAGRYKFSVSATSTSRYSGAALSKKLTVK